MGISDSHLGTRHSRAKRLSHMLEHTQVDTLFCGGDEIDGVYLRRKKTWNFAPWHRQVVAHILRKKAQGTDVIKFTDNHGVDIRGTKLFREGKEVWHRRLSGKELYGIPIVDEAVYLDPKQRKLRWLHGDVPFDDLVFGKHKGFWYGLGDMLHTGIVNVDTLVQTFPKFEGVSFAAFSKKLTKTIINDFMGVNREITRTVEDDPLCDGLGSGHSHMGGIKHTPKGKLILNTGCCTEHVQALVHDRHGNFAFITWHKDRLDIEEENGRQRTVYWKDLGLDCLQNAPALIEDQHTKNADRIIRLIYRMWSPKDRRRMRASLSHQERWHAPPLSLPESLCHPHHEEQAQRRDAQSRKKTCQKLAAA